MNYWILSHKFSEFGCGCERQTQQDHYTAARCVIDN